MTKRKSTEQLAATKPRKRQAFTVARDAATKAIIKRNATESPLLQIPAEIRDSIWSHVLGDRLIHIKQDPASPGEGKFERTLPKNRPLSHRICSFGTAETQLYEDWKKEDSLCCVQVQHVECLRWKYGDIFRPVQLELDLRILRTCRQVYNEATYVLWSTNTFSFQDPNPFDKFMSTLRGGQKRAIKKIHLSMLSARDMNWRAALKDAHIKMLRGLRTLHVFLRHRFGDSEMIGTLTTKPECLNLKIPEGLLQLQWLPFDNVTVVVFDCDETLHPVEERSTKLARRKVHHNLAELIRSKLLDSSGAGTTEEEAEAAKAECERG